MVVAGTVGLVLAAGAGRRYGMPKILVPGWLDIAVGALIDGGCSSAYVVTGAARPPLPEGVQELHCPDWERGMGASLRTGLTALHGTADRVVVHVVDCPDIGANVVARVLGAAGDRLTRAVFDGRPGHPVVLPRRDVETLLATWSDAIGAGPYVRDHPHVSVECADLATGQDIDTPSAIADGEPFSTRRRAPGAESGDDRRA